MAIFSTTGSDTFPTGHVLQMQYMMRRSSMGSTGSYADIFNGTYITITKIAGSNLFIQWFTQMGKSSANVYLDNSKIERATNTGFSSNLTALRLSSGDSNTVMPIGSAGYTGETSYNYFGNYGHTTLDDSITSSAGTYYYRAKFKASGGTVTAGIDEGVSIMYVMEIKT